MAKPSSTIDTKSALNELLHIALTKIAPGQGNLVINLDQPKQSQFGDYACNVALQLAKPLGRSPRDIAKDLIQALPNSDLIEKCELAGPGFINIFLRPNVKQKIVQRILLAGVSYGHNQIGANKKIQVEFVSANPTGPLHVGHGRGAAYGASLANVLAASGFKVTREYYINDAGRQMDILALSTWLRYLELSGITISFPPNAYQGEYVKDMAGQILAKHDKKFVHTYEKVSASIPSVEEDAEGFLDGLIANAKKLLGADYSLIHRFALNTQLEDCKEDLAEFGVTFDEWFSEASLFDSGSVERTVNLLDKNGYIYIQDGAKWFHSKKFGDEKDRVVQRENGQYTYFASDIAYHLNKIERGFEGIIDIWGADHHGYISRVKGALTALNINAEKLTIALVQFAVLYRDGEKVSMSTRAGQFVTLRELRHEVGNDAARFFYVLRKSDQHLDFDLNLAKSQSNDNPVYYIQYAHARICSVLEQWGQDPTALTDSDTTPLTSSYESELLKQLSQYPEIIENSATELSPHLIAFYLKELAGSFHSYYNAEQFLVADEKLKLARLMLINAVKQVLSNGLMLLGVSAPQKM